MPCECVEDIVFVRPWSGMGGMEDPVIVWDRPGGGAPPKIFEKASSRWRGGPGSP